MNLEDLLSEIQGMRVRLAQQQREAGESPSLQQQIEIMTTAFHKIDTALEELQLALQELDPKDELPAITSAVEAERQQDQALFEFLPDDYQTAVQLKSAELLRTVINHSPIVLFALDSEGVFILTEGKGLETLGRKPAQAVGQSVFELYSNYPKLLENVRSCLAGTLNQ